ncbi:MAG: response regulator [Desulfarculus sp.]|nr:response regulator [Desulfarculus sp.]
MHGAPLRVLVLEDNPDDFQLLLDVLGGNGSSGLEISHCSRLSQALELLDGGGFDVVLSDLGLPDSQGLATITRLVERFPALPLVVLTGLDDEMVGVEAVREGAQDYLVKGDMGPELLLRTLRHAIERKKTQEELRQARKELEIRVQERTAELIRANLQLQEEIAERVRTEAERLRLFTAIEQASEAVAILDAKAVIEYVNPAFERITGYSQAETLGRPAFAIYMPQAEVEFRRIVQHVSAGQPWSARHTTQTKDGRTLDVLRNVSPVRDEKGAIVNFVVLSTDVTAMVSLERQLVQAQKLEAIGTLAGGIAHDFNNILTAIIGYTELALASAHLLDEDRQYLEQVLAAGGRARDTVSQILAFSRQGAAEHKVIQIAPIVKEALKLLRASIPTTIELRQYIARDPGRIMGDPTHVHQVLMNLCTNASHAMGQAGGVLEVTLQEQTMDAQAAVALGNLKAGGYLCLSVSDTGQGMAPEVQQRIFEPFFTTKGVGQGTGLGLSVVHGIIKNHGGAISVQSQPGQGTTFRVFLPRVEAEEERPAPEPAPVPRGTGTVLLVDDDAALADLGRIMMERLGYTVQAFTSSPEALAAFRFQPQVFDLVVSDNIMPQMTGTQLIGEIKAIRPDLPVALCTGNNEYIPRESLHSLGISRLIMKPLSYRVLAEHLSDLLGQGRASGAGAGGTPVIAEVDPGGAGDPGAAVSLLKELTLLLNSDMAEALASLDRLGGLLAATRHAPAFRRVDKLVRAFDLEAARQAIADLILGLEGPGSDGPEARA